MKNLKFNLIIVLFLFSCNRYKLVRKPILTPEYILHYYISKNIKVEDDYKGDKEVKKYEYEYISAKKLAFIFCNKYNKCILILPEGSGKIDKDENTYKIFIGIVIKY
jgi:hypothetical protein